MRLLREAHQMVGLAGESRMTLRSISVLFTQYLDHASALMHRYGLLGEGVCVLCGDG